MKPHLFIRKWRSNELNEHSASQSHCGDLCAMFGLVDPATADCVGEWFGFERARIAPTLKPRPSGLLGPGVVRIIR